MWKDFKYKKGRRKRILNTDLQDRTSIFRYSLKKKRKKEHVQTEWQERFFLIPKQAIR